MKTHNFDGVSFFSGLVITVIGLLFLIPNEPTDIFDAIGTLGSWFWPVLLLAVGIAVLIPVVIPSKRQDQIESETDQVV